MKKLTKSSTDKKWDGVLGGLSEYLNVDPTLIRLIFVILTIVSFGLGGVIAYVIAMFIMPEDQGESSN
ncbi:PspC domain-containing protein [Halobacillus yeomjeoni]|uniref:PspC domain-containing protein n=1 Tax=Halobacillus yeomjeoni TaxID=311194 RepID=A0A931HT27_9BACI|nr:PspC domain-containing protein [Halobacillus yeomjeoni]MBH0228951.1 PspC domain-containing protein [Halobacillus yeomjeoni]MCA0983670.1 PspC domain-containing protein [Halobacillus yeomjeoni]